MNISRAKGTKDIFFDDMKIWEYLEETIRGICLKHNMNQIRTPIFEDTSLFSRSVGNETDIVNKEMYTFLDKGDRSITLRPELTAGVVRAYIENGFSSMPTPVKLWYTGTMYRYEKMQKGRYREFSQFGIEIFGSDSYLADVEVMSIAYELFKKIGLLDKLNLKINSIGCSECRAKYITALKEHLADKIDNMCDDCKVRYVKNPMRIIDCKQESLELKQSLPMITDYLCDDCKSDFENLKSTLTAVGIEYEIDKTIVRGLDYYNKTVFEFVSKDLNLTVCGGGRYDTLVELLDGPHTPGIGFGLGMDRVVLLLQEYNLVKPSRNVDVYFIVQDNVAFSKVFNIMGDLRDLGYIADIDICSRSFKAQMKYAGKINAKYTCIIGEDELKENTCSLKNMDTSNQIKVNLSVNEIDNVLKGGN